MAIKNVTVVGGGVMGAGIVEASTIFLSSSIFTLDEAILEVFLYILLGFK